MGMGALVIVVAGVAGCGILIVGLVLVVWAVMQNRKP